jgi:hypothetical protein
MPLETVVAAPLLFNPLMSSRMRRSGWLDIFFRSLQLQRKWLLVGAVSLFVAIILGAVYWTSEIANSLRAANDLPPPGSSVWGVSGHQVDGSTVYLVTAAPYKTFKFFKPSQTMSSLGARPNDVLFAGEASGNGPAGPGRFDGDAYAFSKCGNPQKCHVCGSVSLAGGGPVVELSGNMPYDETQKCQEVQRVPVMYRFTYQSHR